MACWSRKAGARMIGPERVGQDTYEIIEGSLRIQLNKMRHYDWWQAGTLSGSIPTEWEALQYGREHALAHILDGVKIPEAVNMGVKAMYQFAYGEVRDTIRRNHGTCTSATSVTDVTVHTVDAGTGEFDVLEAVASSGLSDVQKRLVTRFMYGWTRAEAARAEGLSVRTGGRRFDAALDVLKEAM